MAAASPFAAESYNGELNNAKPAGADIWMGRNKCFVLESFAAVDEGLGAERIEDMHRRWNKALNVFLFLLHYKKQTSDHDDSDTVALKWYEKLKDLHTDPRTRHYHTLVHLAEMLGFLDMLLPSAPSDQAGGELSADVLAKESAAPIRAVLEAVSIMATFFHDAVYDATSSTNEEDSAELFREFATELKTLVDHGGDDSSPRVCALFDCAVIWVGRYILSTKSHSATVNCENGNGDDNGGRTSKGVLNHLNRYFSRHMLAFLDADMAVLAKESAAYDAYAGLIRKEYSHVPRDVYCEKRAQVLESFLVDSISGNAKFVFATDVMRSSCEDKAKDNLRKEIASLKRGVIPCEDDGYENKTQGVAEAEKVNGTLSVAYNEDEEEEGAIVAEKVDDSNALALGWEALQDPNSGGEYYYNSHTGETAWDKPMIRQEEPSVSVTDDSNPVVISDTVEDKPLPDGWISLTDDSSGRVYFYNEGTGETSWENPVGSVEDNLNGVAEDVSSDSIDLPSEVAPTVNAADLFAQPPIANDAKVSDSDAFAQPPPGVDVPTTVAAEIPPNATEEANAEKIAADTCDGIGVESITDNMTGSDNAAPFASIAEEPQSDPFAASAFDQPPPIDDNTGVELNAVDVFAASSPTDAVPVGEPTVLTSGPDFAKDASVNGEKEGVGEGSPDVSPLPVGWAELFDESSDRVYYYNEESGTTSWDRPSASFSGPPDTVEESSPSATCNSIPVDEGEASVTGSLEDVPTVDDEYAPVVEKEVADDITPEAMLSGLDAQPPNQEQEPLLPEGWEQLVDPTSGVPYYYCKTDGTTSWERPTA